MRCVETFYHVYTEIYERFWVVSYSRFYFVIWWHAFRVSSCFVNVGNVDKLRMRSKASFLRSNRFVTRKTGRLRRKIAINSPLPPETLTFTSAKLRTINLPLPLGPFQAAADSKRTSTKENGRGWVWRLKKRKQDGQHSISSKGGKVSQWKWNDCTINRTIIGADIERVKWGLKDTGSSRRQWKTKTCETSSRWLLGSRMQEWEPTKLLFSGLSFPSVGLMTMMVAVNWRWNVNDRNRIRRVITTCNWNWVER